MSDSILRFDLRNRQINGTIEISFVGKEVFAMKTRIFYHKRTGTPVQIIVRAQTKPTYQEVICYQELTDPYAHYVMEERQFFAEYVKEFGQLPLGDRKQIEKRQDLPDKQPRISKGVVRTQEEEEQDEGEDEIRNKNAVDKMLAFFDAETFSEKIKLLESMKDDLDEHMLNNLAVSLDLSIEEGVDGYEFILSELKIRNKYESDRRA